TVPPRAMDEQRERLLAKRDRNPKGRGSQPSARGDRRRGDPEDVGAWEDPLLYTRDGHRDPQRRTAPSERRDRAGGREVRAPPRGDGRRVEGARQGGRD